MDEKTPFDQDQDTVDPNKIPIIPIVLAEFSVFPIPIKSFLIPKTSSTRHNTKINDGHVL